MYTKEQGVWIVREGDEVVAVEARGGVSEGLKRYTAYTRDSYGDLSEEIDVDAVNEVEALGLAETVLTNDYEAGMRIVSVEGPRVGLYL